MNDNTVPLKTNETSEEIVLEPLLQYNLDESTSDTESPEVHTPDTIHYNSEDEEEFITTARILYHNSNPDTEWVDHEVAIPLEKGRNGTYPCLGSYIWKECLNTRIRTNSHTRKVLDIQHVRC